jgi:nucleotide-binding universal stress UspA family protein
MSEIIVGYDGSNGSRASLDLAMTWAKQLGDTVTVVFAYGSPGAAGGEMTSHSDAVKELGAKALEEATHQAQAAGFEIKTKEVYGHPSEALIAEAEEAKARMIVVGNRGGEGLIKGAILRSVTYKLVHLTTVPVLIAPA